MVSLCLMFQQAGYIVPLITLVIVAVAASFASTMLSEAMTRMPGNDVFQSRAEIITLVNIHP